MTGPLPEWYLKTLPQEVIDHYARFVPRMVNSFRRLEMEMHGAPQPPERSRPLKSHLHELAEQLNNSWKLLEDLEGTLLPVLLPENAIHAGAETDGPNVPARSEMMVSIDELGEKASQINSKLISLMQRCEL